jgi:hypothetical protein
VIRVLVHAQEPGVDQPVRGLLNALSRETHPPGDLRNGQRLAGERDRTEHLPAGRCEALVAGEQIAGSEQQAVGAEGRENDLGCGIACRCSSWTRYDKILSD